MNVDDSLLLSYDRREKKPKPVARAALSPSSAGRYAEDPHRFYLKKVRGLDEPFTMPLVLGIAVHEAQETFLRERYVHGKTHKQAARVGADKVRTVLAQEWRNLEDQTVRVNPDRPESPRGREELEVSLDRQQEKMENLLHGLWASIDQLDYSLFQAQRNPQALEKSVGRLAVERGQPNHEIESYDPVAEEYGPMPTALVAGVPVRGRVDCVGTWPDGSKGIIDHKCVSKVVPYYPIRGQTQWRGYDPNYDAATDLQLDVYSAGAGIARAGFQFMLRRPQYMPGDNVLYEDWYDERDWQGEGMPGLFVNDGHGDLRYIGVWRGTEDDGASDPYKISSIRTRAGARLRDIGEHMTESFLLLKDGVAPEVAFPAGNPDEIAQKACPYCHFGPEETGRCPSPREDTSESKDDFLQTVERREEICTSHPLITERRERWEELRRKHGVRERKPLFG